MESLPREFPDRAVRRQRLDEMLRAMRARYVDLALLFVSGLLLAFAIGYVVGVRAR
jgi:hypothetical protein